MRLHFGTSRSRAPVRFRVAQGPGACPRYTPFKPAPKVLHQRLIDLGYDEYQALRFRRDHALWGKDERGFRVEFFHMGRGFSDPVTIHEVVDGKAREVAFDPTMFDYTKSGIKPGGVTKGLGFAGFRLHSATDWQRDVAAFLGASYFRAVSTDSRQFGLSARGLAIDTAMNRAEEFPRFTAFWFERPPQNSRNLVLYALLDSDSVDGRVSIRHRARRASRHGHRCGDLSAQTYRTPRDRAADEHVSGR